MDDEPKIRRLVGSYLERDGHTVLSAASAAEALELAVGADLMILDLGLPDRSGQDVARQVREHLEMPIIILTARAGEADRIAGLRLGADDYVSKPFSPGELVARVAAVLRRTTSERPAGGARSFGEGILRIDEQRREVCVDGHPVTMTRSEFDLLTALAARPGRVWSRQELANRIRGERDGGAEERAIDAHVKNLRRKLADPPAAARLVLTVTGVGYKLGVTRDG
ncbi:response regulator transcription factor [Pseudonocardia oceani]|uniref:response regulator transcription factor n=1 Tax=Pseudonocardia oceani TaxID=2792013 RepID=UPI0027E33F78|nr:response regulator transcription factor [Pseudonocardia oceani]